MPTSERLGLRAWIEDKLETGEFLPVLRWFDKEKGFFSISWRHASRHGWSQNQDAVLFRAWALHTERYKNGDDPEPKTWKANFRCAVNASSDIKLVKGKGQFKGNNAHRVYAFSKKRRSKIFVAARRPGIKLNCTNPTKPKLNTNIKLEDKSYDCAYRPRPSRGRGLISGINLPKTEVKSEHCIQGDNKVNSNHKREETFFDLSKVKKEENTEGNKSTRPRDINNNVGKEPQITKLYSFKELIDTIPKISRSNSIAFLPKQTHHIGHIYDNRQIDSACDALFERYLSDTMELGADVTIGNNQQHDYEDVLYHAQVADSSGSENEIDMQEIFDDSESYRSHSRSSSSEEWNEQFMMKDECIDLCNPVKIISPLINSMTSSQSWNDPFLGVGHQSDDIISQVLIAQVFNQGFL